MSIGGDVSESGYSSIHDVALWFLMIYLQNLLMNITSIQIFKQNNY